jgi:hypothetical protein
MILEDQRLADQRSPTKDQSNFPSKRKREILSNQEYRLRKERTNGLVEGLSGTVDTLSPESSSIEEFRRCVDKKEEEPEEFRRHEDKRKKKVTENVTENGNVRHFQWSLKRPMTRGRIWTVGTRLFQTISNPLLLSLGSTRMTRTIATMAARITWPGEKLREILFSLGLRK